MINYQRNCLIGMSVLALLLYAIPFFSDLSELSADVYTFVAFSIVVAITAALFYRFAHYSQPALYPGLNQVRGY